MSKIPIYQDMKDFMNDFINNERELSDSHMIYFRNKDLDKINKNVKKLNFYNIDKYGIVIRKNEFNNKKSIFGWTLNEDNEPINIHIDNSLIQTNDVDIRKITIQKLYSMQKSQFTSKSTIGKIFATLDLDPVVTYVK